MNDGEIPACVLRLQRCGDNVAGPSFDEVGEPKMLKGFRQGGGKEVVQHVSSGNSKVIESGALPNEVVEKVERF